MISPTQEAAFKKAILALVGDGSIRQVFPSVDNLQTILIGNKCGAQTRIIITKASRMFFRFLFSHSLDRYPLLVYFGKIRQSRQSLL